jgi:hypothetical protein
MTREQREAELRLMLTSPPGQEELFSLLQHHAGVEERNPPSFGTLLVDTILNYEYPPDEEQEVMAGLPSAKPAP